MKGQTVGYVRVSTLEQNTGRQLDGHHLDRVFVDHASGGDTARPELAALMRFVREGDVVMVHSLDRLARNLDDLRRIVADLTNCLGDHLHDRITGDSVVRHELVVGERKVALGEIGIAVTEVIGAGEIGEAPDGEILQASDREIRRRRGAGRLAQRGVTRCRRAGRPRRRGPARCSPCR